MRWRCVWSCLLVLSAAVVQARLGKMDVKFNPGRQLKLNWRSFTFLSCAITSPGHNHVGSICSTWGREHFKTFDGDVYQFPGLCQYNLVSDCHESFQEFSVHIRRKVVNGNPTVSYVVVSINELSFRLSQNLLTVNGVTWVPASCRSNWGFLWLTF